ncbi:hypothetical protein BgiMline_009352 [Biomphalaria glabrata]|nr:hypothetical protein BgiMline_023483 [Biomphalaria glabrata]
MPPEKTVCRQSLRNADVGIRRKIDVITVTVNSPFHLPIFLTGQHVVQSALQYVVQSALQYVVQSALQYVVQSALQYVVQSVLQYVVQLVLQYVVQSTLQYVVQSTLQYVVQSALQYVVQSALQYVVQSALQYVVQSTLQYVVQSTLQYVVQSTLQYVVQSTLQYVVQLTLGYVVLMALFLFRPFEFTIACLVNLRIRDPVHFTACGLFDHMNTTKFIKVDFFQTLDTHRDGIAFFFSTFNELYTQSVHCSSLMELYLPVAVFIPVRVTIK